MILCGNVFMDELKSSFFLCCVLCKKKSRRYTDFTNHIKSKHKEFEKKEATPPKHISKKIKHEDNSDDDADDSHGENDDTKPEIEVKYEMDIDALEEFPDDIKYDVQEIEPFIDPILALEEKDSTDAPDLFEAQDSDLKDDDYVADDADNDNDYSDDDDCRDEDYRDEEDNDADSDFEATELPISTDKFTPTFYRKKRYVNEFIELYKSQRVLWNINDPLFENQKAQKEAQQAIISGMQKFNIFLKPTSLKSAINRVHKYCAIIKSDLDKGDSKKITSIAKGYYEKCEFLKELLARKEVPEADKQNKPLTLDKWDDNTCKFIAIFAKFPLLYDKKHASYGKLEDKKNAITDIRSILESQENIDFSEEMISIAVDQLRSWYYQTKRRKSELTKCQDKYMKMCEFFPDKRIKEKILCSICEKVFYTEHNLKYHLSKTHKVGDFSFECNLCGKKLVSKTALQYHNLRVHAEKKYPCEFCGKLYAIPAELKVHTRVHTAEKPHVCELCGKCFRLRNLLGLHVTRMHTKIRAFKCTMCPKDFLKNTDLRDHMKTHLNIRDKICETCGKGFTNCHSLIRHRQIHSEVKKFQCKLCDAKFHQFVGLNAHMKRTHNINPLKLDQWDDNTCKFIEIYSKFPLLYDGEHPLYGKYKDKQRAILDIHNILLSQHNIDLNEKMLSDAVDQLHCWYYSTKHVKQNNDAKFGKCRNNYLKMCKFLPEKRIKVKIVCSICNKKFHTEDTFKHHSTKIHQVGDYSHQCDQCGKKYVSKSALQYHAQRVHCEKKYPCEFCGKSFAIPSELKTHTFIHTAEKPHVCELCGKSFRLRNNLSHHLTRMHTKIRAFKCSMCPKDFLKNSDLTDHIKTHLNIRDKICETCGKGFTNCHSLIRHRQIHSEIKKFACKLCDARFHQFVGLSGHMKRTHKIMKADVNN